MNVLGIDVTTLDIEVAGLQVATFICTKLFNIEIDFMYVLGAIYLGVRILFYIWNNLNKIISDKKKEKHVLIMREKELNKWNQLFENNIEQKTLEEAIKDPTKFDWLRNKLKGKNEGN